MLTRASIGGHPVHAMLVHFPIAFLLGTLGLDIYTTLFGPGVAQLAELLLALGVCSSVVAAAPGVVDLITSIPKRGQVRTIAVRHAIASALAMLCVGSALLVRIADRSVSASVIISIESLGAVILLAGIRLGAALLLEHHIGVASPPSPTVRDSDGRPASDLSRDVLEGMKFL